MKELPVLILDFLIKAAPFLIAGALGAVIKRIRSGKIPTKRFLGQIVISAFLAWCIGVTIQHYLNLPNQVTYAIVSLAGMFSDIILDEIEEAIKKLSELFEMYIGSRFKKKF